MRRRARRKIPVCGERARSLRARARALRERCALIILASAWDLLRDKRTLVAVAAQCTKNVNSTAVKMFVVKGEGQFSLRR